jgi:hypothetical protein
VLTYAHDVVAVYSGTGSVMADLLTLDFGAKVCDVCAVSPFCACCVCSHQRDRIR